MGTSSIGRYVRTGREGRAPKSALAIGGRKQAEAEKQRTVLTCAGEGGGGAPPERGTKNNNVATLEGEGKGYHSQGGDSIGK